MPEEQIKPPSKAVLNAWSTVAEYLHENEIYFVRLDIDYDDELTKVKKGKHPFTYHDYETYRRFVLKDISGNINLISKNLKFD